jgi:N-methylhydantoinase A/oxoprolinase/acetone carboxylase beta subunit/N-methylhydantoinase B/oxoprolinase/acetone carboxylase alpha subunit
MHDYEASRASIRVGADVGGTFTDVVAIDQAGRLRFRKVLSTPAAYDEAVVGGIRTLWETSGTDTQIETVAHATTVATNAVLERRGARTALVTTSGFRDVLELRRVRMPHLYDPLWVKPEPLVARDLRFEVIERMSASGEELEPLDEESVRDVARRIREAHVMSVAVCLLHAHRYPGHERRCGEILRDELPGVVLSLSSDVIREQQEYERTAATAVNAYVRPVMQRYLTGIEEGLTELGTDTKLTMMQSAGGIMAASDAAERPVYVLESGPAAGVVAAARAARQLGLENAIAFDMGGTTAKASLIEGGRVSWSREYEVGAALSAGSRLLRGQGEVIRVPTIDIAEVGAGGGSLAWLDQAGGLHVGPQSAGADPGPVCYGRGGDQATVTDADVVLGYIPTGPLADGDLTVSRELAEEAVGVIAAGLGCEVLEAARGIHELANASMMRALRVVSSERGRDPSSFAIVAYGGAGPVHAAALARELGVQTVLVPPAAGGFSATGLLFARPEFHDVRFARIDLGASGAAAEAAALDAEMRSALGRRFPDGEATSWYRSADVRYRGQNWDIEIELPGLKIDQAALEELGRRFEDEHERVYGLRNDGAGGLEMRALRLAALGPVPDTRVEGTSAGGHRTVHTREADFLDGWGLREVRVVGREDVSAAPVPGPLLVDEYDTTVVVPPGWSVRRGTDGTLTLDAGQADRLVAEIADVEAVRLGLITNALSAAADEMATTVFRTAHSTVVRDCMDFSASICGATGEMVAQAVTIPLHLGSVPAALETLLAQYGDSLQDGDVYIMNDPFSGGMHTPDIFIVKPVFLGGVRLGFAVVTAHHADLGGRLPGTASCDNRDIFQEGLRMPWLRLYSAGTPDEGLLRLIATNVRVPEMTLGDLRAQVAACNVGEHALHELAARYSPEGLADLTAKLLDYTEQLVRDEIATWPDGVAEYTDHLDSDGIDIVDVPIRVKVTVAGDGVELDFSDCAPMVRGALNGTRSFAEATAYYVVMSALRAEVPHTAGAFRAVTVVTRPGTVTHVIPPGASSMRGVTGFRLVDALNGALAQLLPDRIPAAGEGGNSLAIFSGETADAAPFVLYELLVGTWGGRPVADGNDGLSNPCALAANIPVELAEAEFPIVVERYGFVCDSGGPGRYRGGVAIERVWRTLAAVTALQVRSDRQRHQPYGLYGAGDGGASANVILDDETARHLGPMFATVLGRGDRYHHRMAGGGGWGDPLEREPEAVARDVRHGKVSTTSARADYGVVLAPDGSVDVHATAQLRASQSTAQRPADEHAVTHA